MKVEQHILNDLKPLTTVEKAGVILDLMEELKFSHLPVLHEGKYVGLVCEDDLLDIENESDILEKHLHILKPYYMKSNGHLFDALHIIGEGNLTLLPVLDEGEKYIGYLSPLEVIQDLGRQLTFAERGSLIVLQVHIRDYHLSQLAQIVESEDAHIIGFHVISDKTEFLKLVLKINQTDISRIIKAFERYDYVISEVFHQSIFDDTSSDRYESLMKYLNI